MTSPTPDQITSLVVHTPDGRTSCALYRGHLSDAAMRLTAGGLELAPPRSTAAFTRHELWADCASALVPDLTLTRWPDGSWL